MRQVVLLLIGLAIGATFGFMLASALHRRSAYPAGVMAVLDHHIGELRRAEREQRCDATVTRLPMTRIGVLAEEIVPSFAADLGRDPHFRELAEMLHRQAEQGATRTGSDCRAFATDLRAIGEACQNCHHNYH